MPDLNALMQQAQAMQARMQQAQEKMAETTADGSSGGGLVKITLKGPSELIALTIDPSLLADNDAEILADLVMAAHADAKRKLDEATGALTDVAVPEVEFSRLPPPPPGMEVAGIDLVIRLRKKL